MTKKRYTEPVILSIEDALGIDEDKINEKQAGKYYESVVFGNKVMDLYRGEQEAYDRKLKEGKIKLP